MALGDTFEIRAYLRPPYKTGKEAKADWAANKDFRMADTGQTVSKSCLPKGKTAVLFVGLSRINFQGEA